MFWYALASLSPAALLAVACLNGGGWAYAALISVTVFVYAMDRLGRRALPVLETEAGARAAIRLAETLALAHFALLALGVWALAKAAYLTPLQTAATALALGLYFGQVSNANAHELIHKSGALPRFLGKMVYASLLFGHHASAHPKVHHVWVASDQDPNSARLGEGFYAFWPRAWIGSFRAGLRAENAQRSRQAGDPPGIHPYLGYGAGSLFTVLLAWVLAGGAGVLVLLGLAIWAQMQLILSDYVQHYGLRRLALPDGRLEPVGPQHSWNAAPWYSAAMMLNAPRHSDHHLHPARPFPALRLDAQQMPMLPGPFPVMATLAMVPPLWRRRMDPRVRRWQPSVDR